MEGRQCAAMVVDFAVFAASVWPGPAAGLCSAEGHRNTLPLTGAGGPYPRIFTKRLVSLDGLL